MRVRLPRGFVHRLLAAGAGGSSQRVRGIGTGETLEGLEPRRLMSAAVHTVTPLIAATRSASSADIGINTNVSGYTPSQVATAYGTGLIQLNHAAATGAGQTIAIVDAYNDPNLTSDLAVFDAKFKLPAANLKIESQTGSTSHLPGEDTGWAREIALDVEWAHATAPAAKLVLVEASTDSLDDLLLATNEARNTAGVSVVSISWGTGEFYGENLLDPDLLTPSGHSNETFVVASGDNYSEQWPASSPNVLSVGGTALVTRDKAGAFSYEKPWLASGGGYSAFEEEPTYQQDVQFSGDRTTPDVSFGADPNNGFAVYDTITYQNQRGWMELGGTSAGAPQWAGLIAIADQLRATHAAAPLNTLSLLDAIYDHADTAQSDNANFHDVWGNAVGEQPPVYVEQRIAGYGYDLFTGFGSPRGAATDNLLVNASLHSATSSKFIPASTVENTSLFGTVAVADNADLQRAPSQMAASRTSELAAAVLPAALNGIFVDASSTTARSAFANGISAAGSPADFNHANPVDAEGACPTIEVATAPPAHSRLDDESAAVASPIARAQAAVSDRSLPQLATSLMAARGAERFIQDHVLAEPSMVAQRMRSTSTALLMAGAVVALAWWYTDQRRTRDRARIA